MNCVLEVRAVAEAEADAEAVLKSTVSKTLVPNHRALVGAAASPVVRRSVAETKFIGAGRRRVQRVLLEKGTSNAIRKAQREGEREKQFIDCEKYQ